MWAITKPVAKPWSNWYLNSFDEFTQLSKVPDLEEKKIES